MPRYRTEIRSARPVEATFAYLSRFDSAAEWDPGIDAATMQTPEPVGVGSRFELVARFAGRRIPLEYEVTEFESNRRIVLQAENASIRSNDTISFTQAGTGSVVTYDAVLEAKRLRWLTEPLLAVAFRRMGDRATEGLRRTLSEQPQ